MRAGPAAGPLTARAAHIPSRPPDVDVQIGAEEKERLRAELSAGSPQLKGVTSGAFYKVPFEDALELVQARRVYLRGGYAYVPSTDVITLVMGVFRARLSAALTVRRARQRGHAL